MQVEDHRERLVDDVPGLQEEFVDAMEAVQEEQPLREVFGVGVEYLERVMENAHSLYERGELERAETLIDGVLALDEALFYPHLLLGDIRRKQGKFEEALESFEEALDRTAEDWNVELRAAEVESELGRESDAETRLDRIDRASDVGDDVAARAAAVRRALEG